MSVKNESPILPQASVSGRGTSRSLRLRLVLWYGALLTVALAVFAVLVLLLATTSLNQSVESSVQIEQRLASLELSRELSSTPPYWPAHLSLQTIDRYLQPGIAIAIVDAQGTVLYTSSGDLANGIPVSTSTLHAILTDQPSIWYSATVEGKHAQVEAVPIQTPRASASGSATGTPTAGPVIGALLVAKSLDDVESTLFLLQLLLLLSGIATLIAALVGGWIIAATVLRPLAEIARTARSVAVATARGTRFGNLSLRVKTPGKGDEMGQVVDTFNEMLSNLESATLIQRRFVADASHELRVPLTTIQGNLAFLRRHLNDLPPEERLALLADAHSETLRLARLVEELLLLARADANLDVPFAATEESLAEPQPQQPSSVELDRVVLQLVRQLRGRLSLEGSTLLLEIAHIEPLRVQGDEEALRRVILILLDNALKYTSMKTEPSAGRVIISLERAEREAVLHVRDTGIGIDSADLPHIFERFYRADRARARSGTGLGLSIAWALVEQQLGGRITVESTPEEGSTFHLWFPLA